MVPAEDMLWHAWDRMRFTYEWCAEATAFEWAMSDIIRKLIIRWNENPYTAYALGRASRTLQCNGRYDSVVFCAVVHLRREKNKDEVANT